jgi:VanZ family protein
MRREQRMSWAWLWVAACVAMILQFSSDAYSADTTGRFLLPLLHWLFPDDWRTRRMAHGLIRKGAHLAEYSLLALLAFRALRLSIGAAPWRIAGLALALVLTVAATDEWRQSLIPTRTGSLADVALDFGGGVIGVLVIVALHRLMGFGAPVGRESPASRT